MRRITFLAIAILYCLSSYAQTGNGSASQNLQLAMAEVVGSDLFSGSSSGGSGAPPKVVDLPLGGTDALTSGVESPEIKVTLQCNTAYDVNVSSSATTFTYVGSSTTDNVMNVKDVLSFMITENNTGGSVGSSFSQYQSVDGTVAKQAISGGQPGARTFSFKYKAKPGYNYSAGNYTADILFTVVKK